MDENNALALVFARNAFYRRMHFLALSVFFLSLFIIAFLIWVISYLASNPVHPLYFATDKVGRLIRIIPVNTPNMSTEEVTNWAINVVQETFSYDYVNYRAQLQGAQKYFTTYGWNNYMRALKASNNLNALTQRKLIITAKVVAKPKIVAQGLLSGAYAWKYQIPLLLTYSPPPYDFASKYTNPLDVTIIVQRQPPLRGNQGLGVVQVIANIASTAPSQAQPISATPNG